MNALLTPLKIIGPLLLLLCACESRVTEIRIPFRAQLGDQALGCQLPSAGVEMTDLRFYVLRPTLNLTDGSSVRLSLADNGRWQSDELVLIDLEGGIGSCRNGTPDANGAIVATIDAKFLRKARGLSFSIGVPFDLNHADPLAALRPLNDSTMHWHWRSGYKFLRAGFSTSNDGFWIHLGSAGCEGTVQNIERCRFPNRFDVTLDNYEPGDSVVFYFRSLVNQSQIDDGIADDCSSGPAEESCRGPFGVFGIDFDSGGPAGEQAVFRTLKP